MINNTHCENKVKECAVFPGYDGAIYWGKTQTLAFDEFK
jgi:hypothetical protein